MTSNGQPPGSRTVSIYDYPEHLNPFYEDDNHNRIRFWTMGRKKTRSNSFSLSGIRNAMTLRSFRGKKDLKTSQASDEPTLRSRPNHLPRSTQSIPAATESECSARYVYGGSVTPTPQPRFQQPQPQPTTPEDKSGSRLSVNSTCNLPGRPPRAPRKKRRAPPPPVMTNYLTVSVPDIKHDDESLNVELKIVEDPKDAEEKSKNEKSGTATAATSNKKVADELVQSTVAVELKIVEETETDISRTSIGDPETKPKAEGETVHEKDENNLTPSESAETAIEINALELTETTETVTEQKIEQKIEQQKTPEDSLSTVTEVTIAIGQETTEAASTPSRAELSVNETSSIKTSESIKIPTPKVRTIIPSPHSSKETLDADEPPAEACKRRTVNGDRSSAEDDKSNYEEDIEETLLQDLKELDRTTDEIKEWLQEIETPQTSVQRDNKDDTNNNHVPPWSTFYRSVTTVANGKHRAEITNVKLNSSPEHSPQHE